MRPRRGNTVHLVISPRFVYCLNELCCSSGHIKVGASRRRVSHSPLAPQHPGDRSRRAIETTHSFCKSVCPATFHKHPYRRATDASESLSSLNNDHQNAVAIEEVPAYQSYSQSFSLVPISPLSFRQTVSPLCPLQLPASSLDAPYPLQHPMHTTLSPTGSHGTCLAIFPDVEHWLNIPQQTVDHRFPEKRRRSSFALVRSDSISLT